MMEEKEPQVKKSMLVILAMVLSTLIVPSAQAYKYMPATGDSVTVHGLAWSTIILDDQSKFTHGMSRAKVDVTQGDFSGCLEYAFSQSVMKQAWGGYNLPWAGTRIIAGRIFIASGNDFPAPYDGLYCWDPLFSALPNGLNDQGVKTSSHFAKGKVNVTLSAINGEGLNTTEINRRPAFDWNVNVGSGGLYASCSGRESRDVRFLWNVLQGKYRMVTVRAHRMENENLVTGGYNRVVMGDLEVKLNELTCLGFSASDEGYREIALGRTLHGKNAVGAYVIRSEDDRVTNYRGSWGAKLVYQAAVGF